LAPLKDIQNYTEYLSLGTEIVSAMLVPLIGGYLVDYYWGTEPWGFIAGALLGFLGVFNTIYKIAKRANRESKHKHKTNTDRH